MSTSKTTSFLSEIAEGKPIPPAKLAFFQARLRHNLYDFIVNKFVEMERAEGLTKAELARRIGCEPALITRRLGAPGNWTLDTISDLLIGIAGEELEPQSKSVLGRAKRNYDGREWREVAIDEPDTLKEPKSRRPSSAAAAWEAYHVLRSQRIVGLATSLDDIQSRLRERPTTTGPSQSLARTAARA